MKYYKTTHPDVLAAVAAVRLGTSELADAGKAFADEFGGEPVFLRSIHGTSFAGVRFHPLKPRAAWTVPNKSGVQSPRAKLAKQDPNEHEKAEHKRVRARWKDAFPKQEVSMDALYEAIGTDWGDLLFNGVGWIDRDDCFYFATKAQLNDRMTEILGSEYEAAAKAGAQP